MKHTVIITGGRGDLASALASEFCDQGSEVLAPGREELDVRDAASVSSYFAAIDSIDLLVNNAGLTHDLVHNKLTEADWDLVVDTNGRKVSSVAKEIIEQIS